MIEVHVFVSESCGWCRKLKQEVDFDDLGTMLQADQVLLHTLPTRSPLYSRQGVPELVVTLNGRPVKRLAGYVPGGAAGFAGALRRS
tara:strand:+ start:970 stop:1230 length:261 start_codon:yes stop_codon:yes gene_type:complete